jgi:hypothetical protein
VGLGKQRKPYPYSQFGKCFSLNFEMHKSFKDLLRATSRSFWLTLRVLPAAVRPQIGLVPEAQPEISQPQRGW